jgi:succinate dehydrogenase / fumarate reductase cytochrome b subunit
MNSVALLWPTAYNAVCEFLGANWYALVASIGLAALFIIHIIYAVWLTLQNRAARGNDRYAVTARQPQVEWASKNMLVLGIVVIAFLAVHLIQFWSKMQLQELLGAEVAKLPTLDETPVAPAQGTLFLQMAFSQIWTPIVYIIGFVALWFHMTHGFWSMFHTCGWDNNTWLPRLKKIANWWTSIVVALFVAQAVVFTIQANRNYYTENEALQEQYAEFWNDQAKEVTENFIGGIQASISEYIKDPELANQNREKIMDIQRQYIIDKGPQVVAAAKAINDAYSKHCSSVAPSQEMQQLQQMASQIEQQIEMFKTMNPQQQ